MIFIRAMALKFDYKIKFSEKVYTYILHKGLWLKVIEGMKFSFLPLQKGNEG